METWRRIAPFVLAGLLVLNLVQAIRDGGREDWIVAALIALGLAFVLWQRGRTPPPS